MKRVLLNCLSLILLILILMNASNAFGAKMTNDDVLKLVEAGMSEELIISIIAKSEPTFDTSTDAVIALSKKGVSQKIISAMVDSPKGKAKASGNEETETADKKFNPEEIIFFDNGKEKPMKYIIPEVRTTARALGWGGIATYMVMNGPNAQLRTTNTAPSFLVSVPKNAQPNGYMKLVSFAVRRNNTRASTGRRLHELFNRNPSGSNCTDQL